MMMKTMLRIGIRPYRGEYRYVSRNATPPTAF
jgi:hypothetical protein